MVPSYPCRCILVIVTMRPVHSFEYMFGNYIHRLLGALKNQPAVLRAANSVQTSAYAIEVFTDVVGLGNEFHGRHAALRNRFQPDPVPLIFVPITSSKIIAAHLRLQIFNYLFRAIKSTALLLKPRVFRSRPVLLLLLRLRVLLRFWWCWYSSSYLLFVYCLLLESRPRVIL